MFKRSEEKDRSKAEWGSDVIIDILNAYGIEFVSFNPGSTFRGIEESFVNYSVDKKPEIILCCHEEVAVAIAHGYAKAAKKPMVTVIHDVVGTMHASMSIYNAFVDNAPMIIISGTGPMDITKRRPWIDWIHTALVQGNLVRDYVKWDDQPINLESFLESFIKAYRVAMLEPKGPVYICLDTELQEQRLEKPFILPDLGLYKLPTMIAADPDAIENLADLLVNADSPLILADRLGRNPSSVDHLIKLAELMAIPVIDLGGRFNFPNTHPLDLTGTDFLKTADLIIALDTPYLYGALTTTDRSTRLSSYIIPDSAEIIQIGLFEIGVKSLITNYHKLQYSKNNILADTSIALPQLIRACSKKIDENPEKSEEYLERLEHLSALHFAQRNSWREEARNLQDSKPVSLARLASDLWEVIKDDDWMLVNGDLRGWARRLWDWTEPHQYIGGSGGAGLGYGMPASIGAALAFNGTGKLCINIQSDGDMLYTCSSLWTAAHHKIPLLVVMNNNRAYGNSVRHREVLAKSRGRAINLFGTLIDDPPVDFASLAKSFGVYGEGPIEDPEDLRPALEKGKQIIKNHRLPALIDVIT